MQHIYAARQFEIVLHNSPLDNDVLLLMYAAFARREDAYSSVSLIQVPSGLRCQSSWIGVTSLRGTLDSTKQRTTALVCIL
jgi:hypothetical protein